MKDNDKPTNYKGIIAVLGIAAIMLCGVIGTGVINSNSLSSGLTGLTSELSTLSKNKLGEYDSKIIHSDVQPIVASAATKKYVGS